MEAELKILEAGQEGHNHHHGTDTEKKVSQGVCRRSLTGERPIPEVLPTLASLRGLEEWTWDCDGSSYE